MPPDDYEQVVLMNPVPIIGPRGRLPRAVGPGSPTPDRQAVITSALQEWAVLNRDRKVSWSRAMFVNCALRYNDFALLSPSEFVAIDEDCALKVGAP